MLVTAPVAIAYDKLDVSGDPGPTNQCKRNARKSVSFVTMNNIELMGHYSYRLSSDVKTEFKT